MKLRGAISGFGDVAERAHLPGWRACRDVAIVAIHDPVAERRHAAMRSLGNARVYDDMTLMLSGEAPDFVDVASPPVHHAATARSALEAGAHVLVEKPLCLTLAELDELEAVARRRGRVLMCVHNWKHAPSYAAANRLIESGRAGEIRYVALERLRTAPAGAGRSGGSWRAASSSGGGILIDHGWHVFYLMQWLMGGDAPASVSAQLDTRSGIDEVADIRVTFHGGRIAYAHLSWRAPVRRTRATLYGDRAIVDVEDDRIVLTDRAGAVEEFSVSDAPGDSYHAAWFVKVADEFQRAIREAPHSPITLANLLEARSALSLMIGARESASNGGARVEVADIVASSGDVHPPRRRKP